MNDLLQYFETRDHRLMHKWTHYFEIYDRHFSRFRGTDVCIVEIGIYQGGSLQMWRDYFGANAKIIGVDIDPRCKELEEEGIEVIIGNQEDRGFLRSLKEKIPRIDILLDDGGHTMNQQIVTFEELFPHVAQNGVYLCEDLHTSYWNDYNGGFRKPSTFIEYSKNLIDSLNAWHSRDPESFPITQFTRSAYSMNFYSSVLVIEKQVISPPRDRMIGQPSFAHDEMIQAMQKVEIGQSLDYELHLNSKDWQGRYVELNSRFFQLFDEHRKLQSYLRDAQNYVHDIQRNLEQAEQQYQQEQQVHLQTQQKLQEAHSHIHTMQEELSKTQIYLQEAETELKRHETFAETQAQLLSQQMEANDELEEAQAQLLQAHNDLTQLQRNQEIQSFRIERLQHKVQQVRERRQRSKVNLENTKRELEDTRNEIEAMKTSKFWKLRMQWLQVKKLFGAKSN
jgi:23S rRNA U2552 (ribose-2'-O)-methylase RlmE/FtsJ/multidrug resistance efflux pump